MADGTSVAADLIGRRAAAGRRSGDGLRRFARRRSSIALAMALPLILLVAGLVIYPAFYAIYLSLMNKKMSAFVGLGQYIFLCTGRRSSWSSSRAACSPSPR